MFVTNLWPARWTSHNPIRKTRPWLPLPVCRVGRRACLALGAVDGFGSFQKPYFVNARAIDSHAHGGSAVEEMRDEADATLKFLATFAIAAGRFFPLISALTPTWSSRLRFRVKTPAASIRTRPFQQRADLRARQLIYQAVAQSGRLGNTATRAFWQAASRPGGANASGAAVL